MTLPNTPVANLEEQPISQRVASDVSSTRTSGGVQRRVHLAVAGPLAGTPSSKCAK